MNQYTDYMSKQCKCAGHSMPGALCDPPCCAPPHVDAIQEKQMDMLGEFIEANPIGSRVFLRD